MDPMGLSLCGIRLSDSLSHGAFRLLLHFIPEQFQKIDEKHEHTDGIRTFVYVVGPFGHTGLEMKCTEENKSY
jgi:hypothetical protein